MLTIKKRQYPSLFIPLALSVFVVGMIGSIGALHMLDPRNETARQHSEVTISKEPQAADNSTSESSRPTTQEPPHSSAPAWQSDDVEQAYTGSQPQQSGTQPSLERSEAAPGAGTTKSGTDTSNDTSNETEPKEPLLPSLLAVPSELHL